MPEQKPSSRIISRSNVVRWRSRSASSTMPLASQLARRAASISSSMSTMASLELVGRRDVVRGGVDVELLALGQQLAGQRIELA